MLIRLGILEEQAGVTADTIQYLIIGGGGGGGDNGGGGGGAGGYRTSFGTSGGNSAPESAINLLANSIFTVTVGAGGTTTPTNGSNSVFGSIIARGGGSGGSRDSGSFLTGNGGSGGGGAGWTSGNSFEQGGTGISGQGFNGGNGTPYIFGVNAAAGGGGGASAAGSNAATASGGAGGNGLASTITGTSVTRAGGGGGGKTVNGTGGVGGTGGGGTWNSAVRSGTVNTGSGGAGGSGGSPSYSPGGAGGSGVVILRYPAKYALQIDGGLTYSHATVGTDRVTTFTAGTGNIQFIDSTNTYELIESVILTGSQASVTFSNLGNYSSTYKHLQIRAVARQNLAVGYPLSEAYVQFNSVGGTSYAGHTLIGNGSNVYSYAETSKSRGLAIRVTSSEAVASTFGVAVIDILDAFSTTKNKTIRSLTGALSGTGSGLGDKQAINLFSSVFMQTNAIVSIAVNSEAGSSFVSGSRFSLYGVK